MNLDLKSCSYYREINNVVIKYRRWARLMFGREFPITDLLLVWDAVFAIGGADFPLLEYIMVAMLTYIKEDCK